MSQLTSIPASTTRKKELPNISSLRLITHVDAIKTTVVITNQSQFHFRVTANSQWPNKENQTNKQATGRSQETLCILRRFYFIGQ